MINPLIILKQTPKTFKEQEQILPLKIFLQKVFKHLSLKFKMVKVDKEKCIGCGLCVSISPDAFEMGEDGKAKVISQKDSPEVKEAVESCPGEAITL